MQRMKRKDTAFRDNISALRMAFPVAMYLRDLAEGRDPEDMRYCYAGSYGGASVLRRLGYDTKVLLCSVVAWGNDWGGAIGFTAETLYERLKEHVRGLPSFDEWKTTYHPLSIEEPYPPHLIFEATSKGDRGVVDLSVGQLSATGYHGPRTIAWYCKGWPRFATTHGYEFVYGPCPYPDKVNSRWLRTPNLTGLEADVMDIMKLALDCDLDQERFANRVAESVSMSSVY